MFIIYGIVKYLYGSRCGSSWIGFVYRFLGTFCYLFYLWLVIWLTVSALPYVECIDQKQTSPFKWHIKEKGETKRPIFVSKVKIPLNILFRHVFQRHNVVLKSISINACNFRCFIHSICCLVCIFICCKQIRFRILIQKRIMPIVKHHDFIKTKSFTLFEIPSCSGILVRQTFQWHLDLSPEVLARNYSWQRDEDQLRISVQTTNSCALSVQSPENVKISLSCCNCKGSSHYSRGRASKSNTLITSKYLESVECNYETL